MLGYMSVCYSVCFVWLLFILNDMILLCLLLSVYSLIFCSLFRITKVLTSYF